ncbi:MAG: hypothetical protein IPM82_09495 [Saprospiraceae bacterium]|nr:hypothetical protein [Saprospiraceae bacterium]
MKRRCRKSERKEYTTPKGGLEDEYRVANNIAKRHGWQFEQGRMAAGSG